MICKKCGTECPDGNIFCEACGAELDAPVLPENIDDKGRMTNKKTKEQKNPKPKKEKKPQSPEKAEKIKKNIKTAFIVLCIIAVIVIIILIVSFINSNKGYNSAQSIPLGRNVEFASAETQLVFDKTSSNGVINSMTDFDYICISDENVKISGSPQPKWVIMLDVADDDIISSVEYYDFTQLKLNWKGRKMADILDQNSLEYGMNIKNANKTLGMKPYYIKRSVSNDSVYCYRYYYTDPEAGYDRVFNYYVEFSDVEMTVRNIHYSEINYAAAILSADSGRADLNISSDKDITEENVEETEPSDEEAAETTEQ